MALIMDQAADGVRLVTGTDNNWVLVADGEEVTLVDAGFPRDLPRVLSCLERVGRALGDLAAIVLTHAARGFQDSGSVSSGTWLLPPLERALTSPTGPARSLPCGGSGVARIRRGKWVPGRWLDLARWRP